MAYLMLYGLGWTQRWRIVDGREQYVRSEIERVGQMETGHLPVVDPGSDTATTLVVAWAQVAAAAILDADTRLPEGGTTGAYA